MCELYFPLWSLLLMKRLQNHVPLANTHKPPASSRSVKDKGIDNNSFVLKHLFPVHSIYNNGTLSRAHHSAHGNLLGPYQPDGHTNPKAAMYLVLASNCKPECDNLFQNGSFVL